MSCFHLTPEGLLQDSMVKLRTHSVEASLCVIFRMLQQKGVSWRVKIDRRQGSSIDPWLSVGGY